MSYIGNTSTTQSFTPAIDYFSGNGSTTAFTLSRPVASVAQVQVTIDNVAQNPSSAYTVSSNTITFTSAPLSGTNNIYVYYTSPITQVIAPGQGTVTATSFVSSTGTGAGVFQTSPTITTPTIDTITSAASTALTLKSAGTTAITVDASQRVGVGVTPSAWTTSIIQLKNSGYRASGNALGLVANAYYDGAWKYIATDYAQDYYQQDGAHVWRYAGLGTAGNSVSWTEGMRIDNGNLLVGTTSGSGNGEKFNVTASVVGYLTRSYNSSANPYGYYYNYSAASPNNASNEFIRFDDSTATRATIRSNGGLANYSANNANLSDQREKKDIELAPNYLDKVCAIPVKTFLFNDQTDTDLNLGVIAQDVQAVASELVMESNWGTEEEPKMRLSIYQTDLQYALMKSIQELKAINDTQAETINALTARIVALENR